MTGSLGFLHREKTRSGFGVPLQALFFVLGFLQASQQSSEAFVNGQRLVIGAKCFFVVRPPKL